METNSLLAIENAQDFFKFFSILGCKLNMHQRMFESIDFDKSMYDKPYKITSIPRIMSQEQLIVSYSSVGKASDKFMIGVEELSMGLRSFLTHLEQNAQTSFLAYVSFIMDTGETKFMLFTAVFDGGKTEIYVNNVLLTMTKSIAAYAGYGFLYKTTN